MTFAAIGERSGYSRSMVTVRFGSKEGLVEELLDQLVGTWSHNAAEAAGRDLDGLTMVRAILDAIQVQVDKQSQGLRVLYALMFEGLGDQSFLRDRFRTFHANQRADLAEQIRRGQRDGSVDPDVDASAEAAFLVAGLRGIGYQWLIDPDGFDASAAFAHFNAVALGRLARS